MPIKQHAYQVNPIKYCRDIEYMLQNGIVESSQASGRSSPCVLNLAHVAMKLL